MAAWGIEHPGRLRSIARALVAGADACSIKSLRLMGGLTVDELASATGVTSRELQYWEAGKHRPRPQKLRTIQAVIANVMRTS